MSSELCHKSCSTCAKSQVQEQVDERTASRINQDDEDGQLSESSGVAEEKLPSAPNQAPMSISALGLHLSRLYTSVYRAECFAAWLTAQQRRSRQSMLVSLVLRSSAYSSLFL